MKTPILPATALALLALTACQSKTTTVTNSTETNTTTIAKPVVLPPSIKAEVNFRCHGDNTAAKVTFFNGETMAVVSAPADASPVKLTAPEAGKPYVADGGYEMTGNEKSIKLTLPGKPAQTCDA